jgi:hypothetical protein
VGGGGGGSDERRSARESGRTRGEGARAGWRSGGVGGRAVERTPTHGGLRSRSAACSWESRVSSVDSSPRCARDGEALRTRGEGDLGGAARGVPVAADARADSRSPVERAESSGARAGGEIGGVTDTGRAGAGTRRSAIGVRTARAGADERVMLRRTEAAGEARRRGSARPLRVQ